ncbi:MAG TPA: DUF397 domain-containing protein [Pseudonocardiaceae bacterium]
MGKETMTQQWRKSTYSNTDGACVEVHTDLHAVRDSKNPSGPTLSVNVAALVHSVKAGRLN